MLLHRLVHCWSEVMTKSLYGNFVGPCYRRSDLRHLATRWIQVRRRSIQGNRNGFWRSSGQRLVDSLAFLSCAGKGLLSSVRPRTPKRHLLSNRFQRSRAIHPKEELVFLERQGVVAVLADADSPSNVNCAKLLYSDSLTWHHSDKTTRAMPNYVLSLHIPSFYFFFLLYVHPPPCSFSLFFPRT